MGAWSNLTACPAAREGPMAVAIGGNVYMFGGYPSVFPWVEDPDTYKYTPSTDAWDATLADITTRRQNGIAAAVNNVAYVIGGRSDLTNVGRTTNEAYTPATDSWAAKTAMTTGRQAMAAAVVSDKIYVIGGSTDSGGFTVLDANEEYDPSLDSWAAKTAMTTARWGCVGAAVNGLIYVFGGKNAAGTVIDTVEEYDPVGNSWSAKLAMPTARYYPFIGVVNDKIYVIGGYDDVAVSPLDTVEVYDPATNTWDAASEPVMTDGRYQGASATVGNSIYCVTGYDSSWVIVTTHQALESARARRWACII